MLSYRIAFAPRNDLNKVFYLFPRFEYSEAFEDCYQFNRYFSFFKFWIEPYEP